MNIKNGFVVPFFTATVDDWSEHKNDILSSLDLEDGDGHLTDYFKYYQAGEIAPYTERMFEILDPAIKDFNKLYPFDFQIFNMWAQKYTRGGYHPPHNHGALGYSAIFYASLESDHQPTSFFAPFVDFIEGDVIEYVPEVSEGDIVFFPSVLTHQCKAVQSDSERVIFSFNIKNA
jgi:hypothetical protein